MALKDKKEIVPVVADKRILAALSVAQKLPGLRTLFKLLFNLLIKGRIRSIDDLGTNKEFLSNVKQLKPAESKLYTKVLVPIGFPGLQVVKGKVVRVSGRRARLALTDTVSGIGQGRVEKNLEQHIEFLQEESFFQKAHKQAKLLKLTDRSNPMTREFYHDYALSFGVNFRSMNMMREGGKKISNMLLGRMYFFRYEPDVEITNQTRNEIYDNYPLIFLLYEDADNFSGINFHYMSPKQRKILLGNMFLYLNNEKYDRSTKILAQAFRNRVMSERKLRYAKLAYRSYRPDNIRSKIVQVHPLDWELAIGVNTERFKKVVGSRLESKRIWVETNKKAQQGK
tara:strand:+ start:598 stop:1617 length:1020 start_codon:yes stop_codon:yes gene_type:complete